MTRSRTTIAALRRRADRRTWALLVVLTTSVVAVRGETEGLQFFERKIRPALVQHCYQCHAAGAKKVGGKLYLDSREGMLRGGESGPSLVAGRPEESLFIRAIQRTDKDLQMPPDDKPPLPQTVAHDFVEWVKMGAPRPPVEARNTEPPAPRDREGALWSFQPLTHPTPPATKDQTWPRDDLDRFILARLESDGLLPTADAPPQTLIRRLYFDLIGLAPTFAEVRSFVSAYQSEGQAAVEALVDQLLASPRFGERWGRHWLDVARYGESNGNDGLGRNPTFPHAWRYRDYVIESFNNDTPYNRFLVEQIAGDLLPTQSSEERNRNLTATGFLAIGFKPAAAMNQNFAMDVVDDQINVVSTGVMGLSVACARCHDHKHDPIATRDYYALAGIFNSTETLWGKAGNEGLTAPATPLHDLNPKAPEKKKAAPVIVKFAEDYSKAIDELKPVVHARLDRKPEQLVIEKGVTISESGFAAVKEGRLRLEPRVPADNYSLSFWFRNDLANNARAITAYLFSHAVVGDEEQKGDHMGIGGTHEAGKAGKIFIWNGTKNDENAIGTKVIAPGSWNHVVLTRGGNRVRLYLNGDPKPEIDAELKVAAPAEGTICVGARSDRFAPLQGHLAELAVFDRSLTAEEAQQLHKASGQKPGTEEAPKPAFAMGVREKKAIADCKINIDGNSKKLGPHVPRGFLPACKSTLSPPTIGTGSSGRLQLADWLTRGDHPQTARVMTNRIWLHLFGRAIVTTPDDFGVYGARPSHPALLDHLATRFMTDRWSMKKMIRTIVLSRTYQLDSRCSDQELLERDSDNALLARHTRRRLDAETIRDRILQAGGNLKLEPGNGSAIDDLDILINWPPGEAKYLHEPSKHRSIYLCILRGAPPAELAAFNLPNGTEVAGQRDSATPPTQGLFFLNNPLVVNQARALAAECSAGDKQQDDESKIASVYHRVLQRDPSSGEVSQALEHIRQLEQELSGADATTRAWASFCQALLASNEFRYID